MRYDAFTSRELILMAMILVLLSFGMGVAYAEVETEEGEEIMEEIIENIQNSNFSRNTSHQQ